MKLGRATSIHHRETGDLTRDLERRAGVETCRAIDEIPVRMPYPDRRAETLGRITIVFLIVFISVSSSVTWLPVYSLGHLMSSASSTSSDSQIGQQLPQDVGADSVPDLHLPKVVLSSIDKLIGAGGVIQASSDNLTLYNEGVEMRLRGGSNPHDELIGPDGRVASSYSFWSVQTFIAGNWTVMQPHSTSFDVLGTNTTGTDVVRVLEVGIPPYTGSLTVVYKATSSGPLKWDLVFTPDLAGEYRVAYDWWNITNTYELHDSARQFLTSYGAVVFSDNYQPFGKDNGIPVCTGTCETHRYTGKPYSSATGLYYDYQRWYDPSIGRFISQDVLLGHASDPQSMNPYVYVENRPTNDVDPSGQFLIEALFGAGIGAGIGYFGCVWATGGWTSSTCGEAAIAGAAVGALAGLTYGASLAFAGGTLGLGTATASGGFVFSGASGLAAFAFAGATSGAVAGGAQYFASGGVTLANGGSWQFNAQSFGESVGEGALLGAATSVAGYGLGKLAGSFLTSEALGPGKLPLQNGAGGIIRGMDESGLLTKIGVYDENGNLGARIDVFGREHAGIQTPHVQPYSWTQTGLDVPGLTGGWTYDAGLAVRPSTSWEKLLIFMLS